jgi:S1-C subfamily serine protease
MSMNGTIFYPQLENLMLARTRQCLPIVFLVLCAAPTWAADEKGFLGVQIKKNENANGIFVTDILKDSPAEKELQTGDVITKLDGKEVNELAAFVKAIGEHKVGDKITLTIERSGKEMEVKITLGKPPKES